jgi:hypothetical protein
MRQLIVAACVGAAASLGGMLFGLSQPGSWLVDVAGRPARGYDIFIHDHYFIVRPAILMVNLVAFAIVTYAVLGLWRQLSRGRDGGAGA